MGGGMGGAPRLPLVLIHSGCACAEPPVYGIVLQSGPRIRVHCDTQPNMIVQQTVGRFPFWVSPVIDLLDVTVYVVCPSSPGSSISSTSVKFVIRCWVPS